MKKIVLFVSDDTYKGIYHFCTVSNVSFDLFVSHLFRIGYSSFKMCGHLIGKLTDLVDNSNVNNH